MLHIFLINEKAKTQNHFLLRKEVGQGSSQLGIMAWEYQWNSNQPLLKVNIIKTHPLSKSSSPASFSITVDNCGVILFQTSYTFFSCIMSLQTSITPVQIPRISWLSYFSNFLSAFGKHNRSLPYLYPSRIFVYVLIMWPPHLLPSAPQFLCYIKCKLYLL